MKSIFFQSFCIYLNSKNSLEQVPAYLAQKTIQTEVSLEFQLLIWSYC